MPLHLRTAIPLTLTLLLAACTPAASTPPHTITLVGPKGEKVVVHVEVADEEGEWQQGLMYRESMPQDHGMLFLFDQPAMLSFWMKNTKIPLDLLYFDTSAKLMAVHTMDPCTADPCPSYPSPSPSQIVLEVNAGFVKEHSIGPGWSLVQK